MQESETTNGTVQPASIFDQLRTVARDADRQMAALRRARHDPAAFVQHDPTETLLALRAEISTLQRDVSSACTSEGEASASLHGLASASAEFVEQRRADLDAIVAFVTQYGYEPPPPPPAKSPVGEGDADVGENPEPPRSAAAPGSVLRPPPPQLDTPEEVQLSDVTVDMLRGRTPGGLLGRTPGRGRTPGGLTSSKLRPPLSSARGDTWRAPRRPLTPLQLPPTDDDTTSDATALLNFRQISLHGDLHHRSPVTRSPRPPPEFSGDAVLVTPGLWVKRRSTVFRQPPGSAAKPAKLAPPPPPAPLIEEPPAAGSQWSAGGCAAADNSMQSPELSEETRAMLARRKFGQV